MDLARDALAVVFVLALLGVSLWTLRRSTSGVLRWIPRRQPTTRRRLETLERVALTPQHALHLVRFEARELIVATHPQGSTLLAEGCAALDDVAHASACSAGTLAGVSVSPERP